MGGGRHNCGRPPISHIRLVQPQPSPVSVSPVLQVNVHPANPDLLAAPVCLLFKKVERSVGSRRCLELTLEALNLPEQQPLTFRAGYDSRTQRLSISSFHPNNGGGSLRIEPVRLRGHRIGTFLMNEIVIWGRQWPRAAVNPIRLFDADADDDNRDRRNRFYERFGFTFEYDDKDGTTGRSREMPASKLIPVWSWTENIILNPFDPWRAGAAFPETNLLIA
jgi:hypothetical protein